MGQAFFYEAGWDDVTQWDNDLALSSLYKLCGNQEASFFVLKSESKVVGMVGGVINEMWFSSDMIGQELFWYVHPDYRGKIGLKLLRTLEADLRLRGADMICMISLAKGMDLAKFFVKGGYRSSENTFIKRF